MPVAPMRLQVATSWRHSDSSTTTSTATKSESMRALTVGDCSEGSSWQNSLTLSARRFILRPMLVRPSMAPCSSSARSSILRRFSGSSHAARLATSRVVLARMVSTILSLLATREEPVSVMSTMAPMPGSPALTSVAPHEYSTFFTAMPRSAKNFSVVWTSSEQTMVPARSAAVCTCESSGTAMTQRAGLEVALEYLSSHTSITSEPFSTTQSWPQIPASRTPSST
mmetsp:Transcript_31219/g.99550  ORF Transcript_31219/g.99550 Transcript_31219/m.99550 type:complete len:226 (-) Transcript_31219:458-1135(-)